MVLKLCPKWCVCCWWLFTCVEDNALLLKPSLYCSFDRCPSVLERFWEAMAVALSWRNAGW